jgi:hypothetical protein
MKQLSLLVLFVSLSFAALCQTDTLTVDFYNHKHCMATHDAAILITTHNTKGQMIVFSVASKPIPKGKEINRGDKIYVTPNQVIHKKVKYARIFSKC